MSKHYKPEKDGHPLAALFRKRAAQGWYSYAKDMSIRLSFAAVKVKMYGIKYYLDPQYHLKIKNKARNRDKTLRYGSGFSSKKRLIKARLVARDGLRCKSCPTEFTQVEQLTVDHITPVRAGGTNELDNLQLLCPPCHKDKDGSYKHSPQEIYGWFPLKEAFSRLKNG